MYKPAAKRWRMKWLGSSPNGEKNESVNYTGRDYTMIKLNATQAAVYTALKRGIRGAKELSYAVDLDYNYISHIIRQLEKLGAVSIYGKYKGRTLIVHNMKHEVVRRPHARHVEEAAV